MIPSIRNVRIGKSMEIEVDWGLPGAGGEGDEKNCITGRRFFSDGKVLERGTGGWDCTIL